MKKFLLVSAGICIAHFLNAQNNVFHLPVQIADGTQGTGKVLTSDSTGLGSWQNPNPSSSEFVARHLRWGNSEVAINGSLPDRQAGLPTSEN